MTGEQFDVLAKLLRSRDPAKMAARLVLVDGVTRKAAAEATGVSGPAITQAVKRYKEAHALVQSAYSSSKKVQNSA